MSEFISWIEVTRAGKIEILYEDDQLLVEKSASKLLKRAQGNNFLGLHVTRAILSGKYETDSVKDFWNTKKLPKELQPKLKDFPTMMNYFGKTFKKNTSPDDLDYILNNAPSNKKWSGLRDLCLARLSQIIIAQDLKIHARYNRSVQDLLHSSRHYNRDYEYISNSLHEKKSPAERNKQVVLLHFNRHVDLSPEAVLAIMKRMRLRPGTIKELLSIAIDHPDLQRKFPIVALGSSGTGIFNWVDFPYISSGPGKHLFFYWTSHQDEDGSHPHYNFRFLCARE